ncbi:MAG TPA: ABC transporter permease [Bryobacteraceae bacterium]|nr:ABC transporter permease [Bryobacteraceae bacterium]
MHRILLIAKRDFIATVMTKAFIFGLLILPILFGGSFLVIAGMQNRANQQERHVAILDRTGAVAAAVIEAADEANRKDMFDKLTGRRTMPQYRFVESTPADGNWDHQRLALSDQVRRQELFAFVEIAPDALHPGSGQAPPIAVYSSAGGIDLFQAWFAGPVNDGLRRVRLAQLGVSHDQYAEALTPVRLESMNLVSQDPRTNAILEPRKKGEVESFAVPYALVLMMAMIVLFSANPMLTAVAEDKTQRVFEMMLASATPFEIMAGKVLAALARSLVSSALYIVGGILALQGMAMFGLIPFSVLPWFFVYLVADVTLMCSLGAAFGSACNSTQDAQQLVGILMLPVLIPLMLMVTVLQQPNGGMSTALSLFPLFTPILMMMRQSMPGGVPAWQPWVGLAGVLVFSLVGTWAAARIFRIGILFQGTTPKVADLFRWAVRG